MIYKLAVEARVKVKSQNYLFIFDSVVETRNRIENFRIMIFFSQKWTFISHSSDFLLVQIVKLKITITYFNFLIQWWKPVSMLSFQKHNKHSMISLGNREI